MRRRETLSDVLFITSSHKNSHVDLTREGHQMREELGNVSTFVKSIDDEDRLAGRPEHGGKNGGEHGEGNRGRCVCVHVGRPLDLRKLVESFGVFWREELGDEGTNNSRGSSCLLIPEFAIEIR